MTEHKIVEDMVKKIHKMTNFKLGKRIGSDSTYGAIFQLLNDRTKVIKLFKPYSYNKGRKESVIAVRMGMSDIRVGPRVHRVGFIANRDDSLYFYMIMDKLDGDIQSLQFTDSKYYDKWYNHIKREMKKQTHKMHQLQFIHGDIKDDNFGYKKNGTKAPKVYLIDFGFSIKTFEKIEKPENVIKGLALVFKDMDITTRNIIAGNYIKNVDYALRLEMFLNKKIKKQVKRTNIITAKRVLDEIDKIQNKNIIFPYINISKTNGSTRMKVNVGHWTLWNPKEVITQRKRFIAVKNLLKSKSIHKIISTKKHSGK